MDIFERAARDKLRFDTKAGFISAEDLFDLPLQSKTGKVNLDDIARGLHKKLRNGDDVSFVDAERKSDETVQLSFDIVKHVIDAKLAENRAENEKRARAEKKQRILAIMADKQDESLKGKSLDELQAELATL
jgi:hypothetical protein